MEKFDRLMKQIIEFRNRRDWKQFHTPENLSKSIAIEAGELLEVFQWGDQYTLEEIEDELADVLIYAMLLADALEIDILETSRKKIELNEKRFPVEKVKSNSGKHTRVDVADD